MNALKLTFLVFLNLFILTCLFLVVDAENINSQELGAFQKSKDFVYWSNQTENYFSNTESKLTIDNHAYVVDYDLFEGYVIIYTDLTEPVTIVDVFSGEWKKTTIKKGYNRFNFSDVGEYGGMRIISIGSPYGFALLKHKKDIFAFEDYPILILKSELAKFSWERAFQALFIAFLALVIAMTLKEKYLISNTIMHFIFLILLCFAVISLLTVDYGNTVVEIPKNNVTVTKEIPYIKIDTYKVKDMWNWVFTVALIIGYILGLYFARVKYLFIVLAEYGKLNIKRYLFNEEKQLIRDLEDNSLCKVRYKEKFRQFLPFTLDNEEFKAILAIEEQNNKIDQKSESSLKWAYIAFFATFGISIIANYLNVFKIDFAFTFLLSIAVAVVSNFNSLIEYFALRITKEKVITCSNLMNENNYSKMLKNAEIKHLVVEFEEILKEAMKEKIQQPRKIYRRLAEIYDSLSEKLSDVVKEVESLDEQQEQHRENI
jgi:hypothetical protein